MYYTVVDDYGSPCNIKTISPNKGLATHPPHTFKLSRKCTFQLIKMCSSDKNKAQLIFMLSFYLATARVAANYTDIILLFCITEM